MNTTSSLLPIDVGFDLRLHDYEIEVPAGTDHVRYLDRDDQEQDATLDASGLRALERAGYRVRVGR